MTGILQVVISTEDRDAAVALAGEAIRRRLASSAQIIGPITSAFWHLGEFGTARNGLRS